MDSGLYHAGISIDGATENENRLANFTAACNLKGTVWPFDLKPTIAKQQKKIELCMNENALLNFIVAKIHQLDPDIIVGHELHGNTIEVTKNKNKNENNK